MPKTGYVSAEDDAAVKDCRVCLLIFDSETNQGAPSLIDMSRLFGQGVVTDETGWGLGSFRDHCSSSKLHQLTHIGRSFFGPIPHHEIWIGYRWTF